MSMSRSGTVIERIGVPGRVGVRVVPVRRAPVVTGLHHELPRMRAGGAERSIGRWGGKEGMLGAGAREGDSDM